MTETHRRRPSPAACRGPLALLVVAAAVAALAAAATPSPAAQAQPDPLADAAWRPLPGDAPLGGHAAVLRGGAMVLVGGERDDFAAPAAIRALDLAADPPRWVTVAEAGPAPQPQLAGRGLVGARTAALDGTAAVMLCDCTGATAHALDWAGGPDATLTWRPLAGGPPLPHLYGLLVHDAPRRRLVAAGGDYRGSGDLVTATFTLDTAALDAAWQPAAPLPFQRIFQAADRDPRSGHLVAFSGQGPDALPSNALWRGDLAALDGSGAWADITALAGDGPAARSGATLTFLGDRGLAVLFGGYTPDAGERADAWLLDYRDPTAPRWRALERSGAPSARSGHSAVWDEAGQRLILYGGLRVEGDGTTYLSDAFALDLAPDAATPPATTSAPTTAAASPTPGPSDTPTVAPTAAPRIFLPSVLRAAVVRPAP